VKIAAALLANKHVPKSDKLEMKPLEMPEIDRNMPKV
jgi:hypothetical protein